MTIFRRRCLPLHFEVYDNRPAPRPRHDDACNSVVRSCGTYIFLQMDPLNDVSTIANQIQLAIAPVFLLAGIGAILNVVAGRLARTVDRSRFLAVEFADLEEGDRARAAAELHLLDRRILAANRAITCCTASALFVCLVVAILFIAAPGEIGFARTIAGLFIAAMALLTAGLGFFLHEIHLAVQALRLRRGPHES